MTDISPTVLEQYVTPDQVVRFVVPLDWENVVPHRELPDFVKPSLAVIFEPLVFTYQVAALSLMYFWWNSAPPLSDVHV
ncbi:hypothetical protein [Streptomyces sp. NPDC002067]